MKRKILFSALAIGVMMALVLTGCSKLEKNPLCPEVPDNRAFEIAYNSSTQVLGFRATILEECNADSVVVDGSTGPLVKRALSSLTKINGWYQVNLSQYQYRYTRVTFIYGKVWHYHSYKPIGVPVENFCLTNVVTESDNDQWFTFIGVPGQQAVTYHLTVNSGYGDGDYVVGTKVKIYADAALPGQHFAGWTGDVSYVANPANSETEVTMPAKATMVTATYAVDVVTTYHLTVNSGYGDGDYMVGMIVKIYADAPLPGQYFVSWAGDISYVADPQNHETTVAMPAKNITVTATYAADVVTPPPSTARTILTRSVGGSTITISGTRPLPAGVKFGFYGNDNIVQRVTPSGNTVTIPATSTGKPFTNYWLEGDEANFLPSTYDLLGGGHGWYNWPDGHTDAALNN